MPLLVAQNHRARIYPLGMDEAEALRYLVERLPEFAPAAVEHVQDNGELLLHVLMGDLARFYMQQARLDPELSARYSTAVEVLASEGNDRVENAVAASLIEWFAWGKATDRDALHAAGLGPATDKIARALLDAR